MKLSLKGATITRGVWLLFAIATGIMVLFVAVLYWHLAEATNIAGRIQHTESVEKEWRELGEDLINAETGQRGYLLTGHESYLAPYTAGVARIGKHLASLRGMVTDPRAGDYLARTEPLVAAKLSELAETIALARQGEREAALAIVKSDRGKNLMDEFRRLRADTLALEHQLLNERRTSFSEGINNALLSTVIGGIGAVAILLFVARGTAARLRQPISELLYGIQGMSEDDLGRRVTVSSQDEIGRLADAFNGMAAHLQEARLARDAVMAELVRSNAELDGFAYVASHDLKSPLRGIRNLAEWISEDLGADVSDETKENLELLRNRVDRLDGLLESLLDYSRVGRRNEAIEQVDTGKLIGDIAQYSPPREGFTITTEGTMPLLDTPKPPLEKVFRNLIGNALKHHDRRSGQVTISARDVGNAVEFCVADDGPGIPLEFQEKIFQMFQTLKPRDQVEGSGMGLAIVKKTVENAGGYVRVESAPPARGARFVFSWPKRFKESG
ncbi:MAG: CHASE3 domain-containing protein [Proteobacteria bacterium]|nr:CHASE3 domain-containing protein [Pseudomonadota bacterium]